MDVLIGQNGPLFPVPAPGEPVTPVIAGALTPAVNRSIDSLKTTKLTLHRGTYHH